MASLIILFLPSHISPVDWIYLLLPLSLSVVLLSQFLCGCLEPKSRNTRSRGNCIFFPSILFHISSFSVSACLYSAVKLPSNLHMVAIVTTYPPSLCAWMCVCVRKFWIQNMSMWTCVCVKDLSKSTTFLICHISQHTHICADTHTHKEVIPVSTKKESLYLSAFISSPVFIHCATPSLLP